MRIMHICVDLSEAPTRCLAHAKVHLPVRPDTVARFTTPLWIPESHIPNGPVGGIAALRFYFHGASNAGKSELKWSRDPTSPHEYLVRIPADTDSIVAEFDAIFTRNVTRRIVQFGWELVLLYPIGDEGVRHLNHQCNVDKIPIQASVTVPSGWRVATALENIGSPTVEIHGDSTSSSTYHYLPTTVRRLADSPILTGLHFRQYTLSTSTHFNTQEVLCIAADADEYTQIPENILSKLSNMVSQTQRLFGGGPPPYAAPPMSRTSQTRRHHHNKFYFLLAVTAHLSNIGGIEHLSSAVLILPLKTFHDTTSTQSLKLNNLPLITHEYIHSWNGKHRIPRGHNPPDFNTPLDGRLLWVYEGLTTYYEGVLSVRAGMLNKQDWLTILAGQVAYLIGQRDSREWRSLEDLGTGASVMSGRIRGGWESLRGERDGFYIGGGLVWLGVDVLVRTLTGRNKNHNSENSGPSGGGRGAGVKSLDDFMTGFFGLLKGPQEYLGQAEVERDSEKKKNVELPGKRPVEYTLDDIVDELNGICEYDWGGYFHRTVVDVMPEVDLSGIQAAGYRFTWTNNSPSESTLYTGGSADSRVPFPVVGDSSSGSGSSGDKKVKSLQEAIWNSIGVQVACTGRIEDVRRGGPADAAGLAPRQTILEPGRLVDPDRDGDGDGERIPVLVFDIFALAREITKCAEDKMLPLRLSMGQEGDKWVVEIEYHDGLLYPRIERDTVGGLPDLFDDILRPLSGA